MSEAMLSLGLDVGTTSTSLVLSRLEVENLAGSFCVPELSITQRVQVIHCSQKFITPQIAGFLTEATSTLSDLMGQDCNDLPSLATCSKIGTKSWIKLIFLFTHKT